MNWKRLLFLLCMLFGLSASAQKHTLSGFISDAESGEELIGATVFISQLASGTTTNLYGFYSLTLEQGTYEVTFSFIGYEPIVKTIELTQDVKQNIELGAKSQMLKEFEVKGEREDANLREVQMSVEKVEMKTIEKIPQFMGEADVVRSIQLLPGVSSVGEGAPGFNVRGGNIDQNLLLLDEAPVYNSSHLFGFFSVFNPDAVKDVQLYKGGIPSRYGGRLSSVMDVRQREGNSKKFKMNGGIGTVSSRLTLEGPIVKDKVSFLVSGRRSYADLFLLFNDELKDTKAYFYDLNAKVNYTINDKNRLFLSTYLGRDVFGFGSTFENDWGNKTASLRWNHLFNEKLFSNFTAIYADYGYALSADFGGNGFEWESNIYNYNLKTDLTYYLNPNNTLEFGVNGLFYNFRPGRAKGVGDEALIDVVEVPHENAFEPAIYVGNEQRIGARLTLQYGLRYSHFFNMGGVINEYEAGTPTDRDDIISTTKHDDFDVTKDYGGFEPRFGANYQLTDVSSLKLSYNRMRQYIHLVSNTTAATPIDVWKPAGKYVKPGTADQVALGYYRNLNKNMYQLSVEGYYKTMNDLLDYRDGAELILNETVETEFLTGDGRAYGAEFMFKKTKGKLTGWISYTLSKTERQVKAIDLGSEQIDGINGGDWYNANWDKPHDFSLVAIYDYNKEWDFGLNFIFATGRPITYPESRFVYDDKVVPYFSDRNSNRVPATHRLDVSATYTPKKNESRKWKSSWIFSVYNLYGRRNPYSIYFRTPPGESVTDTSTRNSSQAYQLSIIGIPVPSVTYNFTF